MDQLGRSQQIRSLARSRPLRPLSLRFCLVGSSSILLRGADAHQPELADVAGIYTNLCCTSTSVLGTFLVFRLSRERERHDSPTDMPSLPVPTPGKGQVEDAKNSDAMWQSWRCGIPLSPSWPSLIDIIFTWAENEKSRAATHNGKSRQRAFCCLQRHGHVGRGEAERKRSPAGRPTQISIDRCPLCISSDGDGMWGGTRGRIGH